MHSATHAARREFRAASGGAEWLSPQQLEELDLRFPRPPDDYGYDPASLEKRGRARAAELLPLIPRDVALPKAIEIGCGDGMVARFLRAAGCQATGLDLDTALFDDRAAAAGVQFVEADARSIPFEESCFDFTYSFNSFEHFDDPGEVIREMIRITRPGGRIHLKFGPLYMSPFGLHAYRSLGIPYCQILFPRAMLEQYVSRRDRPPIPFDGLNGWTPERFRDLWGDCFPAIEVSSYREVPCVTGLELVREFPNCFRCKTDSFESLLVSDIEVVFRRLTSGA